VSALTTTTTTTRRSTEDLEVMPYLYDSGTHRYQMSFQGFTVTPWMADSERPKPLLPCKNDEYHQREGLVKKSFDHFLFEFL